MNTSKYYISEDTVDSYLSVEQLVIPVVEFDDPGMPQLALNKFTELPCY